MRLPVKEFMQMEAERMFNGRVLFMVSAEGGFDVLISFLNESMYMLRKKKEEFPPRVGVTLEEAESLMEELRLIRYGPLGVARPLLHNGELWGPTEVRRTGTAWDRLPKLEAEVLPDSRVALTLARGELGIFANCVEVAIEELVPTGSVVEREEFQSLKGMTIEEAEELRDELLRLDRETRVRSSR